jgi:hypothetical protein
MCLERWCVGGESGGGTDFDTFGNSVAVAACGRVVLFFIHSQTAPAPAARFRWFGFDLRWFGYWRLAIESGDRDSIFAAGSDYAWFFVLCCNGLDA